MAKIGLKNFRYGLLTEGENGAASYATATKPGKAVSCSVSIENNDVKLYADDTVAESDTSFAGGTVTMGIDEADLATLAALLGHDIDQETNEMVRNTSDTAPYVGLGRVITKMVGGVTKYKVEFLSKVKMSEPSQEDTTKGESVEFGTIAIEGQVMALANGEWSKTKQFDTEAEAITYLEGLFTAAA